MESMLGRIIHLRSEKMSERHDSRSFVVVRERDGPKKAKQPCYTVARVHGLARESS